MFDKTVGAAVLVVVFVVAVAECSNKISVPEIQVFAPRGVRICIPDLGDISKVRFNGFINRHADELKKGDVSEETDRKKNGKWTIEDVDVVLQKGDVLHYQMKINGKDAVDINGNYVIKRVLFGAMSEYDCGTSKRVKRYLHYQHQHHINHGKHCDHFGNGGAAANGGTPTVLVPQWGGYQPTVQHWGNGAWAPPQVPFGTPIGSVPWRPYGPPPPLQPPSVGTQPESGETDGESSSSPEDEDDEGVGFYPQPIEPGPSKSDREEPDVLTVFTSGPPPIKISQSTTQSSSTDVPTTIPNYMVDIRVDSDIK